MPFIDIAEGGKQVRLRPRMLPLKLNKELFHLRPLHVRIITPRARAARDRKAGAGGVFDDIFLGDVYQRSYHDVSAVIGPPAKAVKRSSCNAARTAMGPKTATEIRSMGSRDGGEEGSVLIQTQGS